MCGANFSETIFSNRGVYRSHTHYCEKPRRRDFFDVYFSIQQLSYLARATPLRSALTCSLRPMSGAHASGFPVRSYVMAEEYSINIYKIALMILRQVFIKTPGGWRNV